ncbi:hypothetical protein AK830_g9868 [Neonectria ditissima]|uniref:Mitochondrial division protein 1 n=1 Tax=Neonectria ditissima TaxID=78410 RepID=A0A0P7B8D9_9HYPO|nr:hypothetical protein AK830_g9868 [Neonectria ditissima]
MDPSLERWVALKIVTADSTSQSQELITLKSLDETDASKFAAPCFDSFIHAGPNGYHQCLVSEFLGPSLDRVVTDYHTVGDRLDPELILRIAKQLLEAVASVHRSGYAHGDISGANVVFAAKGLAHLSEQALFDIIGSPESSTLAHADGKPLSPSLPKYLVESVDWEDWVDEDEEDIRLVDWGEAFAHGAEPTELAQPGDLRAPEIIFTGRFDHRIDLWRVGCTIYFMIFAARPFWFLGDDTVLVAQMNNFIEEVPAEWQATWQQMKDKSERPFAVGEPSSKLDQHFHKMVHDPELLPLLQKLKVEGDFGLTSANSPLSHPRFSILVRLLARDSVCRLTVFYNLPPDVYRLKAWLLFGILAMEGWLHWVATFVVILVSAVLYPLISKIRRRGQEPRPNGIIGISTPSDAKFDIIAVHGLAAHPDHTWTRTSKNTSSSYYPGKIHLLRDLLEGDFPDARILSFAHNSDWLVNAPRVPIIFVGHSFGGIIIKQALCQAALCSNDDDASDILNSTSGIIFLGTPHQGSPASLLASYAALLTGFLGSSAGLLYTLRDQGDELSDLEDRFIDCMNVKASRSQKTELVAFYETKPLVLLGCLSLGLVVPRNSARGGHAPKTVMIDTDHSGLNKCRSRDDELYKQLKGQLERIGRSPPSKLNDVQLFVMEKLKPVTVADAMFNSSADQHKEKCLEGTRVELLQEIATWAANPNRENIYWLQGKAGTGKSTIARTVARDLGNRLGASFFFERNNVARGSARYFLTTLASQLSTQLPSVATHVYDAIRIDPEISGKALVEQFNKLILAAVQGLSRTMTIVIDALDECESELDVGLIISKLHLVHESTGGRLKFFITSRVEFPIRCGFKDIQGRYIELPLHEIPEPVIEDDITVFLITELNRIRRKFNIKSETWPEENFEQWDTFQQLKRNCLPLFISAATACRFIDKREGGGPNKRLQKLLLKPRGSDHHRTYHPILNQMAMVDEEDRGQLIEDFRDVVGSIITLTSHLSVTSLERLLQKPAEDLDSLLDFLDSALSIPNNRMEPIKPFHQSFRDYLIDPDSAVDSQFFIDEKITHKRLTVRSLQLLSENLKRNICELQAPGTDHKGIDPDIINRCLPPELQYATLNWVYHLKKSKTSIKDNDQMHTFLQTHLLHWLEALALLGQYSDTIQLLDQLQDMGHRSHGSAAINYIRDAQRFAMSVSSIIEFTPLQVYSSGLLFAPVNSIVRQGNRLPSWIANEPEVESDWGPCLQTIEEPDDRYSSICFSEDGKLLLSSTDNRIIKIHDVITGVCLQQFRDRNGRVASAAFSSDSRYIASISAPRYQNSATWATQRLVEIWSVDAGTYLLSLLGHSAAVTSIGFSLDGHHLGTASKDETIKVWNALSWTCSQTLKGHTSYVLSVTFSSDSQRLASGSADQTVKVWNLLTGTCILTLQRGPAKLVKFSHDGQRLASATQGEINIWDLSSGACIISHEHHSGISSISWSSDDQKLAIGSSTVSVKIVDTGTGIYLPTHQSHSAEHVAFSPNSRHLALASLNVIRILDASYTAPSSPQTRRSSRTRVESIAISSDGNLIASSANGIISLRNTQGECLRTLTHNRFGSVSSIVFFIDGLRLAAHTRLNKVFVWDLNTGDLLESHGRVSAFGVSNDKRRLGFCQYDETITILSTTSDYRTQILGGHLGGKPAVAFSPDGHQFATTNRDREIKIWEISSQTCLRTIQCEADLLAVSTDGQKIAAIVSEDQCLKVWNVDTDDSIQELKTNNSLPASMAFSGDGQRLAFCSSDADDAAGLTVWNTATWVCTLNVNYKTERLDFDSTDSSRIYTDKGVLKLDSTSLIGNSETGPEIYGYGMCANKTWILKDGRRFLWVPADYRPTSFAILGSTVVLGCESGRVIVLQFVGDGPCQ